MRQARYKNVMHPGSWRAGARVWVAFGALLLVPLSTAHAQKAPTKVPKKTAVPANNEPLPIPNNEPIPIEEPTNANEPTPVATPKTKATRRPTAKATIAVPINEPNNVPTAAPTPAAGPAPQALPTPSAKCKVWMRDAKARVDKLLKDCIAVEQKAKRNLAKIKELQKKAGQEKAAATLIDRFRTEAADYKTCAGGYAGMRTAYLKQNQICEAATPTPAPTPTPTKTPKGTPVTSNEPPVNEMPVNEVPLPNNEPINIVR